MTFTIHGITKEEASEIIGERATIEVGDYEFSGEVWRYEWDTEHQYLPGVPGTATFELRGDANEVDVRGLDHVEPAPGRPINKGGGDDE